MLQRTNSKTIEQLKREDESRLRDLNAELDTVNSVMEIEHRRLRNATSYLSRNLSSHLPIFLFAS